MPAEQPEPQSGKLRKRTTTKTATRQTIAKVKATIHLSVEADQRLSIHATMMGLDRSALVERIINENLRRFVVSDRGGVDAAPASEPPDGQGRGE